MDQGNRKLTLIANGFDADDTVPDSDGGDQVDSIDDKNMDFFQDLLEQTQDDLAAAAQNANESDSASARASISRCAPALAACEAAIKLGNKVLAAKTLQIYLNCTKNRTVLTPKS